MNSIRALHHRSLSLAPTTLPGGPGYRAATHGQKAHHKGYPRPEHQHRASAPGGRAGGRAGAFFGKSTSSGETGGSDGNFLAGFSVVFSDRGVAAARLFLGLGGEAITAGATVTPSSSRHSGSRLFHVARRGAAMKMEE